MINSFNVITERNSIYEIMASGIGFFAHVPDREPELEILEEIIRYFTEIEMYEKCIELTLYMEEHFNADGSERFERCECDCPVIEKYEHKMVCGDCKLRIRK